ncbi:dihydrolipoyl dehydrogenase [Bacillus sp. AFS076308]|uniref:dihydrolipoyl dehydrogenase n=1 Tax=unclassified Bacillus (in: firmicutes) TaxID=185979 RepID=UPI000BF57EBD|nr:MULTISPECIES: dihydrolipoyl dehydrogenase [unclassified Bacillus (in: firmicutes)]PFO06639.1 dihydrolipoyl dehydrogenase [Bacillus sp. AFS076308]PGV52808.1 dihydrolipoyl dehydrogenase [Bacillus sp. AFS037270]
MTKEYDIVIIGGGPGGYVAAIRASQLGLKVAVVEKGKVGGTCLHAGCIPTKALLRSAELYAQTKNANRYGVIAPEVGLDFTKVQARKEEIQDRLYKGIQHLMKKGKIDIYEGKGSILESKDVLVQLNNDEGEVIVSPRNILIATGSRPRTFLGLEADEKYVMTSDEALEMETLPKSIIIVGGGVIGIEWASMLVDFDIQVTVIEYADRILPTEDKDVSKEIQRLLKKKGVKIVTGAKVLSETLEKGDGVSIKAEHKEKEVPFSADKLLVSVGRLPNIEGIGLDKTAIEMNGVFIKTNEFYQTNEPNIYAIGDVIGGLQLAHVASHEGIIAIEHMAGKNPKVLDPTQVPKCVYCSPEVASVGLTEDDAKEKGFQVKTGKFSFRAIGKALVFGESDGFIKLVVEEGTNKMLGAHMVGPHVTDMITEFGLAQVLNATSMDIAHMIHPHPTLAEAIGEAALDVDGKAIHA